MKKTFIILAAAVIGLTSCGGGSGDLKADIEKGTKMDCERKALEKKMEAGDSTVAAQLEKATKEMEEYGMKIMEKYKDKMEDKSFREKAEKYEKEAKEKYCK